MTGTVKGNNSYCGPAAIALLTGVTTDDAARIARDVTGKRSIKSLSTWGLQVTLRRFFERITDVAFNTTGGNTLTQVARRLSPGSYVVNVTGHYVVVVVSAARRVKVGDNKAGGMGPLRGFNGNRKRVKRVFKVEGLIPLAVRREKTVVKRRATAWRQLYSAAKALPGFKCLRDTGDETEVILDPGYVVKGEGTHGARSIGGTRGERAQDLLVLIAGGTEPCECEECEAEKGAEQS